MLWTLLQSFSFISLIEEWVDFFANLAIQLPLQQIKYKGLDKKKKKKKIIWWVEDYSRIISIIFGKNICKDVT